MNAIPASDDSIRALGERVVAETRAAWIANGSNSRHMRIGFATAAAVQAANDGWDKGWLDAKACFERTGRVL